MRMVVQADRFLKQLLSQEWNIKPCRGRQMKTWGRVIDCLFVSLKPNGWRILREQRVH